MLLLLQLLRGQTLPLHLLCGGCLARNLGTHMKRQGSQPLGAQILMGEIIDTGTRAGPSIECRRAQGAMGVLQKGARECLR